MTGEININKNPSFTEIYYEGFVEFQDKKHYFWLIYPQHGDDKGQPYSIECKFWFMKVPKEVRDLIPQIIEHFKETRKL